MHVCGDLQVMLVRWGSHKVLCHTDKENTRLKSASIPSLSSSCTWPTTHKSQTERLVLIAVTILAISTLAHGLPLVASRAAVAEGRGESIVDVLLAIKAHREGRDVNHLLSDPARPYGITYRCIKTKETRYAHAPHASPCQT